ncbi:MAG: hypothetical protein A2Z91_06010 [Deltaproteobacteria bacterium GWA2_38_16]|nr:MAG: hypothetical protein A2Z91_06010 [Deltaproteobacteria bacterium GWA2_38_16]OGQ03759.1 MAG: hypothetical protein A3D19_02800 [Deltaproteobacteria bacterium RIFCSPHIGHO2_02_FULL_38_15]OGQ31437.1 MAG: hypothetical protein A3A72_07050 [Deltaproteobacteria bacterium RIFCSPLOWO2_01_FULL_38_9]OGQ58999.1 MAG: hypothetical protein A3G92_00355 [Deltaproteobacteria bacterium RIFCSPLOWO2_12_FULL_38_8]HBQ21321.1 hypothetical protein [Deltaproteobacteria bacterium]
MKKIWIALLVLGIVGCATPPSKRDFPQDAVKDIVVGKTTQREIYDTFGTPIYHGTRSENECWWMYIHTTDDNSESLSLYFDKEGKVEDMLYSPFRQSLKEKMASR